MKTISLKLPAGLSRRLDLAAKRQQASKSSLVRAALEQYLNGNGTAAALVPISALELAGDLIGCAEGPSDLSTSPRHMEGYGE